MSDIESKGQRLPCPRCGNPEAAISVSLAGINAFECLECGENFTADELINLLTRWQPILKWLETIPTREA